MPRKPILCLDFDGVIHGYQSGWQGAAIIPDPPVPGAIEFLHAAVERFRVAIYSSRSGEPGGIDAMRGWLTMFVLAAIDDRREAEHVLGLIEWPTAKPSAFVTIDDLALTFDGRWPGLDELAAFQPWTKRERYAPAATAPSELERLREEVAYWRRDLEARLWSLTARYRGLRAEGREDEAALLAIDLRGALASYSDAKGSEWHERCDACGEFVLPGEPRAGDDEISGHARCLGDVRHEAPAEPEPADNLDVRAADSRAALNEPIPNKPARPRGADQIFAERRRVYVYRLPDNLTRGYCFDGGHAIEFWNVDWFDVPVSVDRSDFIRSIKEKRYYRANARFLVLGDPPELTFVIDPRSAAGPRKGE
ncbi:hypothetical protein [Methylobacterium aquaticum]|uniref:Uncharacterized protein n=1 Tax=Methylobacterium aquaticum TaxID=270351 RepID=A0A1Y0ZBZ6_9HYPH|nr:hypothetical protein [Methylobacterium aquaticum]BAR47091.1 hypothetical protein Maq22A_c27925 [Methylobacterium aquaticum]